MVKEKVLQIRATLPRLGTRKLYHLLKPALKKASIAIGRDSLFSLLRQEGLLVVKKKRYCKTTDSKHWMHKYPDLRKDLKPIRPEQLWVSDITYLSLKDANCYLHLITDGYSKKIMGYCLSETMAATGTLKALRAAIANRKYEGMLIHHSDRGLQYCSSQYTSELKANDIAISMTQSGSPYDNAVAERVNGILKDEFGLDEVFDNSYELEKQLEQSIALYNYQRPHISNHMLTPDQMHQQNKLKIKDWHKKPQEL